jgi:hypothetical protein
MMGLLDRPCSRPSPTGLPKKTWQKRQKCQVSPERIGKTWQKRQKCRILALAGVLEHQVPRRLLGVRTVST